ncbi:MAG: pantetheine-phosphate adenylyltransferase [Christensenellales bacterium]
MKTALYAGSFDPITMGHLDIIQRASMLFDKLYVGVFNNASKTPCFSEQERIRYIQRSVAGLDHVEVISFDGLQVEFAKSIGAQYLVRGIRSIADFAYEIQISSANKHLSSTIETILMIAAAKYEFISSSIVKEIGGFGGDIKGLVPEAVYEEIKSKLSGI